MNDETSSTVESLVMAAMQNEPQHLEAVYAFVMAARPNTAEATIRARLYEELARPAPRIFRVARGVYVGIDGPARLVMIEGDAWDVMMRMPTDSVDLLMTDSPFRLGTELNATVGTTRPHKNQGRSYDVREIDETWLREAFRIIKKTTHRWASIAARKCSSCGTRISRKALDDPSIQRATRGTCPTCDKTVDLAPQKLPSGPGVCVLLTPPRTQQTRHHIDALIRLAEDIGFVWLEEFNAMYSPKGAGYWPPQRHWLLTALTPGPVKKGVAHDLSVTSSFQVPRVIRASRKGGEDEKREHEAEKPVELYDHMMRAFTLQGDVVFDPFMGRGRCARHMMREGRHVVMIEKDDTWTTRAATEDWQLDDETRQRKLTRAWARRDPREPSSSKDKEQ